MVNYGVTIFTLESSISITQESRVVNIKIINELF